MDKWLKEDFPKLLKKVKRYKGILFYFDESNIKLSSLNGKTWAPKNQRAEIKISGKRGSVSAISAISKEGDLVFFVYDGMINSEDVIDFLKDMLKFYKKKHLFILMDNASVHRSDKLQEFEAENPRLHIENFPPYWPKYNPDEYVWNYLKNIEMKNYSAKNKNELMDLVVEKLGNIADNMKAMKSIFMRCPLYSFM